MLISETEFKKLSPLCKNPEVWTMAINEVCPKYGITRGPRLWMFIAQCGHESAGFTVTSENLNYSRDGLLKIFKKYFTPEQAEQYKRKPVDIANRVYANRMGNGPEASGDGWKYRGQGPIQLTGKNNYTKFSKDHFGDSRVADDPSMLQDPFVGIAAACWFWSNNKLNQISDTENVTAATKVINGGTHGLDDRVARYKTAKSLLQVS